jgi:PAS domain S-box-containing protein
MPSTISRLTEVGIKHLEGEETDLITRVKIANISILIILAAFFTIGLVSAYLEPAISFIVIAQIIGLLTAYVFNFVGNHLMGRILFCLVFSIGMFLLHIQLVAQGEELLPITVMFQMTFWILPLNLFHPKRESSFLIFTTLVSVLSVAILPYAIDWIEDDSVAHVAVFRTPLYFFTGTLVAGIVVSVVLMQSIISNLHARRRLIKVKEDLLKEKSAFEATNAELRNSMTTLEALQASEEIRKRSILYQAELSDTLRNYSRDLEKACDRAISLITRYIGADAGALFLHEETGNQSYLEMIACYANGKRKYISKKFSISEGLVGQVFMERAHIVASHVPEDYIQISSGLGQASPTHLLLVPMMQNDIIVGVMEFASFRPFDTLIIEMAEKLANVTASIIITTRINQRTQELLEQSQRQTEDLRAREEEMRQNMEELAATQEEMARINDELSNKSIAVNILLGMLEIDANKKILSANDNFTEMMGYSKEELLKMTHTDLVPFDVYTQEEYELWWDSLIEGKVFNGKFIRKTKSGKNITLNCCYRPIFSPVSKDVVKIIKYCYPVMMKF